jgi:hypothetical protein
MRLCRSLFATLLLALPSVLLAQSTSASLTGLVDDPSKALIPGATITAINTQTGEKASTMTNKEGQYVLPGLNPGTYRIEVDKPGFKGIIEAGLTLHVQDAVQINFHMALGSSSETVTVNASQININTTDGTVSTVIDQSYIANMPLNGRSFQDLILLTPGVVTNTPQAASSPGQTGEFSVNGQRTEENYYTVDGVSANVGVPNGSASVFLAAGFSGSLPPSTALGTTQGLTNVDALQEFRVQSSSYSAEYGRNPGGQFAFETKSGTSQPHGSLFDYMRNGAFDSADWFNGYFDIPYPEIHQNDFGGTFGAPVFIPRFYEKKDKTFFFVSFEGLRLLSPQPAAITYVPDMVARTTSAQALQPVLNAFTVANGVDLGGDVAEYIGSWSNPSQIDSTSVRLDHALNDKTRLFFRFSGSDSYAEARPSGNGGFPTNPSNPSKSYYALRTYTLGENSAFSKNRANELRVNYTSNAANSVTYLDGFGGAIPVNMEQAAGLLPLGQGSVTFYDFANPNYGLALNTAAVPSSQTQLNLVDTVSLVLGAHSVRFGVDYRRLMPYQVFPRGGFWFYDTYAQLQTNTGDAESFDYLPYHGLYTNFSAYAQDEWRATNRLNLSFGIRWDLNPPPGVTSGLMPYALTGLDNPNTVTLAPYGTPLWHTTWFNLAPRLGAAYRLHTSPGRETVLRAGGGLFFDTAQQLGSAGADIGPGTASYSAFLPGDYPELPQTPPITNPPTPPYAGNLYAFDPHLQMPYTLQWNASLQQALGSNQSLTMSYVGSHAARLLETNQVNPTDNPDLNQYLLIGNGNSADYNSLQVQFQRKLSAGLTALASYTWSHCLDYGSTNIAYGYIRGNCSSDVRNNFNAAISYDVPSFAENRTFNALLSHWGVDNRVTARTAFPVDVGGDEVIGPYQQTYIQGISFVPGQPIYIYGANCTSVFLAIQGVLPGQSCPGGRGINPNAFVQVNGSYGDVPRDSIRGFGAVELDTAVRRQFPIHERLALQFRAEAFNVLNHPNFGTINSGLGSNTFGLAQATLANSLGTLSPLYQMGGARSMQFALKLTF